MLKIVYLFFLLTVGFCLFFRVSFPQPNFGASLHILKVEIGGDAQSTGMDFAWTAFNFLLQWC